MPETDELGRPKPHPDAYLRYGSWWRDGAPIYAECPPDCPLCAYERETENANG